MKNLLLALSTLRQKNLHILTSLVRRRGCGRLCRVNFSGTSMEEDVYPTRVEKTRFLPRRDPVLWGQGNSQGPLTSSELSAYDTSGYVTVKNVFTEDQIKQFLQEAEKLQDRIESEQSSGKGAFVTSAVKYATEPGSEKVRSVFEIHKTLGEITRNARLIAIAKQILADDVYIHQSRMNFQSAFRGTGFYWHSDFETWHAEDGMPRMRCLSCVVFLSRNRPANGALMVMPGSHKTFVSCVGATPDNFWQKSLKHQQDYGVPEEQTLTDLARDLGIEYCTGDPGDVVVFDCNLLHASHSNASPWNRINIFMVYNSIGNRVRDIPYCSSASTRPEHVATRDPASIKPLQPM